MQGLTGLAHSPARAETLRADHERAQLKAKAAMRGRNGAGPYTNAGECAC
jgi:hypothetical protein